MATTEETTKIVKPIIDETQVTTDAQTIENGLETQKVPKLPEERLAGLSAWGARALLKTIKPLEKQARKKVTLIKKPTADIAQTADGKATNVITPEVELKQIQDQANDITNAELKRLKTTDSHQVNFDTIESGDDVTETIAQMAELNKKEITEARSRPPLTREQWKKLTPEGKKLYRREDVEAGKLTDVHLIGLANDLGQDPNFLKDFLNRQQGQAVNAETVIASRQMLEQSAIKLKELALKVNNNEATDIDKLSFSKQWQFHRQFTNQFMGMRAEFGRGLRAFGVPMQDVDKGRINEMMGMVSNDMSIDRIADQIATMDTSKGINQIVMAQESIATKGTKVFVENFIASILSGVKTQIVNTSGAALRLGMDIPDTLVASVVGKVMPDTKEKIVADEALAKIYGLVNGFQDAVQTGWKVAKTTEPYGGIDKLDMLHQRAITSEYLGIQKDSVQGKMIDMYGTIVRAPLERVMGGVDGFFKVIAERSQLAGIAYRQVANSGLQGQEAREKLAELMANPTSDMINTMEQFGLDVTFQKPLGETGQAFQNVVMKSPALKIFVPFIKTPTNLMKQAFLERSPLGLFSQQYKDDIAAGGARAQVARAKMINGTMLSMSSIMWAMNGTITGSNPKDAKARNARLETGWRPRSFVFDNEDGTQEYISYDRMEPFSYLLGTIADLVEYQDMVMYDDPDQDADKAVEEAVVGIVSAFAQNTVDKTFMTGIKSIMQVMSDPKRYGKSYVANMANSVIPLAGIRRDLAKINDDTIKEAFTVVQKIKRSTPGFNTDLPPRLDNYGEPIKYDAILSPWAHTLETKDKVKLEVQRLVETTRSVALTRPFNRIEGIKLNVDQYHELVNYSRKTLEIGGLNFHATLQEVMSSDLYKEAPTDDARVMIINNIKRNFDEAGRAWLQFSDEALKQKIEAKKERKILKLLGDR